MRWVVLAVVLFVIGYTLVMVFFRKPGHARESHQEAGAKSRTTRLIAAGYQRVELAAERPADPSPTKIVDGHPRADTSTTSGGIDSELGIALTEKPLLADAITQVTAAANIGAKEHYRILFAAALRDHKRMISGGVLFRRDNRLFILPVFEPIQGQLLARTKDTTVILTVPGGSLQPGRYHATLIGEKISRQWDLTIK